MSARTTPRQGPTARRRAPDRDRPSFRHRASAVSSLLWLAALVTACSGPGRDAANEGRREAPAATPAAGVAAAPTDGLGSLPASFAGELPGAGNPIAWHLDLLPEGRYQLRLTHVGRPEPSRFDDIGRWLREPDTGRLVLRGGREAPVYLLPVEGGAALRKLDLEGQVIESEHNDRLARLPAPAPIEPRLLLTGMFTYLADAAAIKLCADDRRLPVAMEGDYRALEGAYLQSEPQPGQPLLVTVEGLIALRPSAEEGRAPLATLVVERFVSVRPRETCGTPLADSPLRGTYWKLVRLGQEPVAAAEGQREASLVFDTEEPRVAGSGGCNRINGGFELEGEQLRFGRMAATRMACPDGMDLEQRFLTALGQVQGHRIAGSHLELLDAAGNVAARFEAVALR